VVPQTVIISNTPMKGRKESEKRKRGSSSFIIPKVKEERKEKKKLLLIPSRMRQGEKKDVQVGKRREILPLGRTHRGLSSKGNKSEEGERMGRNSSSLFVLSGEESWEKKGEGRENPATPYLLSAEEEKGQGLAKRGKKESEKGDESLISSPSSSGAEGEGRKGRTKNKLSDRSDRMVAMW